MRVHKKTKKNALYLAVIKEGDGSTIRLQLCLAHHEGVTHDHPFNALPRHGVTIGRRAEGGGGGMMVWTREAMFGELDTND